MGNLSKSKLEAANKRILKRISYLQKSKQLTDRESWVIDRVVTRLNLPVEHVIMFYFEMIDAYKRYTSTSKLMGNYLVLSSWLKVGVSLKAAIRNLDKVYKDINAFRFGNISPKSDQLLLEKIDELEEKLTFFKFHIAHGARARYYKRIKDLKEKKKNNNNNLT